METKEYRTVDKSEWGDGAWREEPDKLQWPDPTTGLPCLIVRSASGALCGYVGVPDSHPWYQKSYRAPIGDCNDDCYCDSHWTHNVASKITIHGGLTFSDSCADAQDGSQHICHVPGPGEPDHVWWFGFDCAYAGDLPPKYHALFPGLRELEIFETYRDAGYVREEVTRLAQQLASVTTT